MAYSLGALNLILSILSIPAPPSAAETVVMLVTVSGYAVPLLSCRTPLNVNTLAPFAAAPPEIKYDTSTKLSFSSADPTTPSPKKS